MLLSVRPTRPAATHVWHQAKVETASSAGKHEQNQHGVDVVSWGVDSAQPVGLLNKHGYLKPRKFHLDAQACDECIFELVVPAGSPGA